MGNRGLKASRDPAGNGCWFADIFCDDGKHEWAYHSYASSREEAVAAVLRCRDELEPLRYFDADGRVRWRERQGG